MKFVEMISKKRRLFSIYICAAAVLLFSTEMWAQSRERSDPTPILKNELRGEIKARDVGDSRLTTYYYLFNGQRGDVFINIQTLNFNGDIDVFTADGLKPKTKVTIYVDTSDTETGRVVYMRKPESLIMRIQGRTPNDDPGSFHIKFAGSFKPADLAIAKNKDYELPVIDTAGEGTVKVNSVGTIIEEDRSEDPLDDANRSDEPPEAVTDPEKAEAKTKDLQAESSTTIPEKFDPRKTPETVNNEAAENTRPRLIITDTFKKKPADNERETPAEKNLTVEIKEKPSNISAIVTIERDTEDLAADTPPETTAAKPTWWELRKIRLVIEFKNGTRIERRMSQISSVNVFDGVLKVVEIDGTVIKYSILEVKRFTIQ